MFINYSWTWCFLYLPHKLKGLASTSSWWHGWVVKALDLKSIVIVYAGSSPGHDRVFYIFLHLIFVYFYCQNIRFCAIFVGIFIGLWSCTIITIHMTQYVLVSEHMNRMSKLIRALLSMWLKCQMSMARNARLLYVWAPMQYTPPPSLYETAWVFKGSWNCKVLSNFGGNIYRFSDHVQL